MATYAQLAMAAQAAKDDAAIKAAQDRELQRREKASKWGGWGRTLGLLGAGLSTGGMSLLGAAVATGLGGLAGRSVGRALGGGRERDAEKDIDALFYKGARKDYRDNIGDYQKGMRERMLVDTGRDMFSAYTFNKYMKPKVAEAWGDMKTKWTGRFGTDAEKLAMATGDPQALDKLDRARNYGLDEFGNIDSKQIGILGKDYTGTTMDDVYMAAGGQDPSTIIKSDPSSWGGFEPSIGYDDLPANRPLPPQNISQRISPINTEALMDTNLLNIAAPSSTNVNFNQLPIQPAGGGVLAPEFNPNFENENYLNNAFNLWRGN
mgnify:CR=1 FL=1